MGRYTIVEENIRTTKSSLGSRYIVRMIVYNSNVSRSFETLKEAHVFKKACISENKNMDENNKDCLTIFMKETKYLSKEKLLAMKAKEKSEQRESTTRKMIETNIAETQGVAGSKFHVSVYYLGKPVQKQFNTLPEAQAFKASILKKKDLAKNFGKREPVQETEPTLSMPIIIANTMTSYTTGLAEQYA